MKKLLTQFLPYDFEKKKLLKFKLSLEIGFFLCLLLLLGIVFSEHYYFKNNINPVTVLQMVILWKIFIFSLLIIVINTVTGIVIGIIRLVKKQKNLSTVLFYLLNVLLFLVSVIYLGGTR